ncbi:MAG: hypothetical protein P8103_17955 [Candidatus Thiodiazotropha sp.]
MKRSVIREFVKPAFLDYASLHPGYTMAILNVEFRMGPAPGLAENAQGIR